MEADVGKRLLGTNLPDVTLPATDGADINLAVLPGRSVIAVYPWTGRPGTPNPPNWDDIPGAHGSTPELERFGALASRLAALGAHLFGLSQQDAAYQRELTQRLTLPFPILSDAGQAFSAALALPSFAASDQRYLKRLTLVARDGKVEHVFHPVPDPATHADDVLGWLEARGVER